jgi:hypothetical protein
LWCVERKEQCADAEGFAKGVPNAIAVFGFHSARPATARAALFSGLTFLLTTLFCAPPRAAAAPVSEERTIDVLVVHTAAAKGTDSDEGWRSRINALIAGANKAYEDSGIDGQLRLVGVRQINYTESANAFEDDLDALASDDTEAGKTAQALRTQLGADVVCLLRKGTAKGIAGLAYLLTTRRGSSDYAYSVVDIGSADYAFPHEIGHNQGCHHDREKATVDGFLEKGLFDYSYGYKFKSGTKTYNTIMAYSSYPIMYFSTPDITYAGVPIGKPSGDPESADNVSTINFSFPVVAAYRSLPASTLAFTPDGGKYSDALEVAVAASSSESIRIRYTLDGSPVTGNSSIYTRPVKIKRTTTLNARAYRVADNTPAERTKSATFTLDVSEPPPTETTELPVISSFTVSAPVSFVSEKPPLFQVLETIKHIPAAAVAVVSGDPACFEVVVQNDNGAFDYIWLQNDTPIPDAPSQPVYEINALADNVRYAVRVVSAGGSVTSESLTIELVHPPAIIRQPEEITLNTGATGILRVEAAGSPQLTYQWYKDGFALPNAILSELPITNAAASSAGFYKVEINNRANRPVMSREAEVRVVSTP